MTHAVRITDGTTTISLVNEGVLLTQYTPDSPTALNGNVTETIEVYAHDPDKDKDVLVQKVRDIERLLDTASRRLQDTVYLEVRVDGQSEWWRSPIFSGRVELNKNTFKEYYNVKAEAAIHIERAGYFEGGESPLNISASGQSAREKVRLTNGSASWFQVEGSQIAGSVPSPARLRLTNTSGSTVGHRDFYFGINAFNAPTNFDHLASVQSSNKSWPAGITHSQTAGLWKASLTQTQIEACNGDSFHVIGVFNSIVSGAYLRCHVGSFDYHDQTGPEISTGIRGGFGTEVIDFGSFLIPSTRNGANNAINIHITVRGISSGFGDLVHVLLMPTETFRRWRQAGLFNGDGYFLEEDASLGAVYRGVANVHYGGVSAYGQPMMLWPGRTQRVYLVWNEDVGFVTNRRMDAQLWYRPRRLTI